MDVMQDMLEAGINGVNAKPVKIWGSGGLNKNVLWLNVRSPTYPGRRGRMKIALNDYYEAFSVRYETCFFSSSPFILY